MHLTQFSMMPLVKYGRDLKHIIDHLGWLFPQATSDFVANQKKLSRRQRFSQIGDEAPGHSSLRHHWQQCALLWRYWCFVS